MLEAECIIDFGLYQASNKSHIDETVVDRKKKALHARTMEKGHFFGKILLIM